MIVVIMKANTGAIAVREILDTGSELNVTDMSC